MILRRTAKHVRGQNCKGLTFGQKKNDMIAIKDITYHEMEADMSGSLHVRNLDDDLIIRLKRRAGRHGHSAEAEHRAILAQALAYESEPDFERLAADLRCLIAGRKHTPSEVLLREGRKER